MQDYIDFAKKNGIVLQDHGKCQFCGANTKRGVHECLEIFNLGFQGMAYSNPEFHIYRFLIVDAHTLQHPEIHGRWSNHFHLSRLHLIFKYEVKWTYGLSPRLSDWLNQYKARRPEEYLDPPKALDRGNMTARDVLGKSTSEDKAKESIENWAAEVYAKWKAHHAVVDQIAKGFLGRN